MKVKTNFRTMLFYIILGVVLLASTVFFLFREEIQAYERSLGQRLAQTLAKPAQPARMIHEDVSKYYFYEEGKIYFSEYNTNQFTAEEMFTIGSVQDHPAFATEELLADINTFHVIGETYGKDATTVFYRHQKILGADPETFTLLTYGFTRDDRHVWFNGSLIHESASLIKELQIESATRITIDGNAYTIPSPSN